MKKVRAFAGFIAILNFSGYAHCEFLPVPQGGCRATAVAGNRGRFSALEYHLIQLTRGSDE